MNGAEALWAAGEVAAGTRRLRALCARYPLFDDPRAALAAALWAAGKGEEAEAQWARVEDARYARPGWAAADRRWPAPLAAALDDFTAIRAAPTPR